MKGRASGSSGAGGALMFFLGMASGGLLVSHLTESSPNPPPDDPIPIETPEPPDELREPWCGGAEITLEIEDRKVTCKAAATGFLRPEEGFEVLEADVAVGAMHCGEETTFVRDAVFRIESHPKASLVALVGNVDRDEVVLVDQVVLLGRRLMADGVEVQRDDADQKLTVSLAVERYALELWEPTVAGRPVGEVIGLQVAMRPGEDCADE